VSNEKDPCLIKKEVFLIVFKILVLVVVVLNSTISIDKSKLKLLTTKKKNIYLQKNICITKNRRFRNMFLKQKRNTKILTISILHKHIEGSKNHNTNLSELNKLK
jgi:hypothetical protein